jgi:hypothetical protein
MCDLASKIQNFERRSALAAHTSSEAAEKAKARRKAAESNGELAGPPEHRRLVEKGYDDEIRGHEKAARVHKRRADHAANGFLVHSPDESTDADYMREHGGLFAEAHKAGLVRYSDESA